MAHLPQTCGLLLAIVLATACAENAGPAAQEPASPSVGLPTDVAAFIERRDLCDHFRGEEPYDEERARFLEERLRENCTGTDAELAALRAKYRADAMIGERLARPTRTRSSSRHPTLRPRCLHQPEIAQERSTIAYR